MFSIKIARQTKTGLPIIRKDLPAFEELTFCSWVKLANDSLDELYHKIFFALSTPAQSGHFQIGIMPSGIVYSTWWSILTSYPMDLPTDVWSHYCVSSGSYGMIAYINGTNEVKITSTGIAKTDVLAGCQVALGNWIQKIWEIEQNYRCTIGEFTQFFLFGKSLTKEEVEYVYNNNITSMDSDLLVTWSEFMGTVSGPDVSVINEYPPQLSPITTFHP